MGRWRRRGHCSCPGPERHRSGTSSRPARSPCGGRSANSRPSRTRRTSARSWSPGASSATTASPCSSRTTCMSSARKAQRRSTGSSRSRPACRGSAKTIWRSWEKTPRATRTAVLPHPRPGTWVHLRRAPPADQLRRADRVDGPSRNWKRLRLRRNGNVSGGRDERSRPGTQIPGRLSRSHLRRQRIDRRVRSYVVSRPGRSPSGGSTGFYFGRLSFPWAAGPVAWVQWVTHRRPWAARRSSRSSG